MEHRAEKKKKVADESIPACPNCKGLMSLRTATMGKSIGKQFKVCRNYPDCKGIASIE
jgi:ssDNA-binding Zn-finger/Zn-ribbon topoisomerase 1